MCGSAAANVRNAKQLDQGLIQRENGDFSDVQRKNGRKILRKNGREMKQYYVEVQQLTKFSEIKKCQVALFGLIKDWTDYHHCQA